jgi:hypothetical protein
VLRISATLVDSYNYWLKNEYAKEESLIDSIKGIYRPGWQAEHGKGLHYIFEDAPDAHRSEDGKTYTANGVTFQAEDIEECLKYVDRSGANEVKVTGEYDAGEPVTVVTKADQLLNAKIVEYKSKWSPFDMEAYVESYQWKFYLENFGANECRYKVFCFDKSKSGVVKLKSIEEFSCYRYQGMRRDLEDILRQFVGYVNMKGLREYLDEDRKRAA